MLILGPASPVAGGGIAASGLFLARWILWAAGEKARREALRLAAGEGLKESWIVDSEDLAALARAEEARQGSEAQTAFFALTFAGLFVAVTGMIPLPWWAGLLLGVGLGLFGLALSAVHKKISLFHLRTSQGDVFIGQGGVMVAGIYTEWTSRGRRLIGMRFDPDARLLVYTLENAGRHGKTTREVLVPVPSEKVEAAQSLVLEFSEPAPTPE